MRIGFLSHQWPGARMGGIGSAVRQTAAALASAGHDVHVFTLNLPPDARANIPAGVAVHETPSLAERVQAGMLPPDLGAAASAGGEGIYRLAIGWLLCAELLKAHRDKPFDVVETPEVEALGLPILLNPDLRLPVVTHLHCCTAIAHLGNDAPVGADEHLIRGLEFATIALAQGRCAPTQRVVDITREFMKVPEDAAVIPHPVMTSDGAGKAQATPADGAEGAILFFGRVERLKGVETIARALNTFLPRNPRAVFRFVGPDTNTAPDRKSMIEHLKAIINPHLHARVAFVGEVGRDAMAREIEGALFCVLPSLWENFSMACCEAMAAGRAVVVGEGTGSVEVVGEAGIVAKRGCGDDLARQMEHVYRDDKLRQTLGRQARERVETVFSPQVVAEQRARFYGQVIEQTNRGPGRDLAEAMDALPRDSHAAVLRAAVLMTGAITACAPSLQRTPGTRLLAIMEELSAETAQPAHIILYGAGKHTTRLLGERSLWEARGHRIVGVIDDHPRFTDEPTFLDLPVRSVSQSIECASHPPIVLSTDTYTDAFWKQTEPLRQMGVRVFRLYE